MHVAEEGEAIVLAGRLEKQRLRPLATLPVRHNGQWVKAQSLALRGSHPTYIQFDLQTEHSLAHLPMYLLTLGTLGKYSAARQHAPGRMGDDVLDVGREAVSPLALQNLVGRFLLPSLLALA